MKKEILNEINRTREIMGLGVLIEQEEKVTKEEGKKVINKIKEIIEEIVEVYAKIDPAEREEFKEVIIGDLKKEFKDKEIKKEEAAELIKKLLERLKGIEKQPIKEQRIGRYFNWRKWRRNTFNLLLNVLTLNLLRVKRFDGIRVNWDLGDIKIRGARKGGKGEMDSLDNITVKTPESEWEDLYDSRTGRRFKKRIVKGKKLWDKAWTVTETNDEGEKIYKYRPVMISALETFKDFDRWGRRKVKITISDKPEETKIPVKNEITYTNKEFQFPRAGQPSADFFEDNEFAPTQEFKDNLQEQIIGPLQEMASELNPPEGKPAFWLKTLAIATSCSAINNGESSDGKTRTWVELAEDRAKAGLEYIKQQLATLNPPMVIGSNGGGEETQIVINAKGSNVGKKAEDGRDLTGTSGDVWGDGGSSKNKADYEKNKYFDVAFDIVVNDVEAVDPDEEITFETIYTDKLAISYNIPRRSARYKDIKIKFNLPTLKLGLPVFGWLKGLFPKRKKNYRTTDCPIFLQ
jgi:hypothetical protein